MLRRKILAIVISCSLAMVILAGCDLGSGSGKGKSSYEGYWFIQAELDGAGEEIDFWGNTRFNISLLSDGSVDMYSERYNYEKEFWHNREDIGEGFTYEYDKQADEVIMKNPQGQEVKLRKARYKDSDVVEFFPLYLEDQGKTILSRINHKPN